MNATHLACLTPAGTGAVATLGLRGPDAWSAVRELAQGRMPAVAEEGGFWLTRLGGVGQGQTDEVVVAVKNVMPELWLELHCHGGREVIRLLSELFCAKGVVVSSWQEFMQPLPEASWRTAAMEVLTQALTTRTAGIALDQCQGALVKALGCLHLALEGNDISHANHLLAELEQHAPVGLHLATPWRIVIAGAPMLAKAAWSMPWPAINGASCRRCRARPEMSSPHCWRSMVGRWRWPTRLAGDRRNRLWSVKAWLAPGRRWPAPICAFGWWTPRQSLCGPTRTLARLELSSTRPTWGRPGRSRRLTLSASRRKRERGWRNCARLLPIGWCPLFRRGLQRFPLQSSRSRHWRKSRRWSIRAISARLWGGWIRCRECD